MKKIILSILALACGVFAQAKTAAQLGAEYDKLGSYEARVTYLNANRADGVAAYAAWDAASAPAGELKFFSGLYYQTDALDGIPDAAAIRLNFDGWARKRLAKDREAFAKCKAAKFVVDGYGELPARHKISFAILAGDSRAVYDLDPFEVAHCGNTRAIQNYIDAVKSVALASASNEAYGKTLELENAFEELPEGAFKAQTLVVIARLQDALFYRVLRAKKLEEADKKLKEAEK